MRRMPRWSLFILAATAPASALLVPSPVLAYGEPEDIEPHLEERALHFHTDRLRVDPGSTDTAFDTYPPVRPLVYSGELHAAARFYADDMAEHGCFPADHSSCDGTPFGTRVSGFYSVSYTHLTLPTTSRV